MTATDMWLTNSTTSATSAPSTVIPLNGRKLGIRWDANSVESPYEPRYAVNGYEVRVWGSADGTTKNRLVELLAIGPQELNERAHDKAFLFYQGSINGLTVPYSHAIVEFNNKTGEVLGSNDLTVWVADAEPLDVKIPVQGFWGSLKPHTTTTMEQVRDYARVIRYLDVTVFIDRPGILEFYEQSWNSMRLTSTYSIAASQRRQYGSKEEAFRGSVC